MIYREFQREVAKELGVEEKTVKLILDTSAKVFARHFKSGEKHIPMAGYGNFYLRTRKARKRFDVMRNEWVDQGFTYTIKFLPDKKLKADINHILPKP